MISCVRVVIALLMFAMATAAPAAPNCGADCVAEPALERLTLREAERSFAARNREVQVAQRALQGAQADQISASARPNPNVYLNATQIGTLYPSGYDATGITRRADLTVGVNQLLERGNKRELRMGAAGFNVQATRGDLADIQRQQGVALNSAYWELVLAQEKVRIAAENVASFDKTVDAANLRLKAGDIAPSDLARIRVDALRAQNDARSARADQEKAQAVLAYLIGAEAQSARIRAVDAWPPLETAAVGEQLDAILGGRADVQAAQARVLQAQKNQELAHALRTRDVTVMAQFDRTPWNPVSNETSQNTIGFGISVPLFTNYYYEGEIRRAEVDLQAARDNLERVRALALGEIGKSRADLDATLERAQRFEGSLLEAARKAAGAAEFAYSKGAIGVMDLLDARRQLYATRLDAATTLADYAKSLAAWQAAVAVMPPVIQ